MITVYPSTGCDAPLLSSTRLSRYRPGITVAHSFVCLLVTAFVVSIRGAKADDEAATQPSALFMVGALPVSDTSDKVFLERVQSLGFAVDAVLETDKRLEPPIGIARLCLDYDIMLVSASCTTTIFGRKLNACGAPIISWEEGFYRMSGLAGPQPQDAHNMMRGDAGSTYWGIDGVQADLAREITIVKQDDRLFEAFSVVPRALDVFTRPFPMSWARVSHMDPQVTVLATLPGDPTKAVCFVFEAKHGSPSIRIGLPIYHFATARSQPYKITTEVPLSAAGAALFDKAVQLAASHALPRKPRPPVPRSSSSS